MPHRIAVAFESLEKPVHATQRCRAERVAVIAIGKGDEVFPFGLTALLAVLQRELQRAFDRGRAVVGIKDPLKRVGREETAKFFRELDGGRVGEPQKRHMRNLLQLIGDRFTDRWMPVAMNVRPDC